MAEEKTKWTGLDDDWLDNTRFPRDDSKTKVSLEP
jgi:hypothetical protein